MLVTAQRVTSPDGRRSGVNAFLYMHGTSLAEIDWKKLDREDEFDRVVQTLPSTLDAELIEVAPGGNSVLSFVDIIAPDDAAPAVVLHALTTALELLRFGASGSRLVRATVAVRINAELVPPDQRKDEFHLLTEHVGQLLTAPPDSPWRRFPPLRVVALRTVDGWKLSLDAASAARIRSRLGAAWRLIAVQASDEVLQQLRDVNPDLLPHVLASAVGLSEEAALSFGGVEVVDAAGDVLRSWPDVAPPPLGSGFCLRCHRHNTLVVASDGGLRCTNCGNVQADDGRWVGTLS